MTDIRNKLQKPFLCIALAALLAVPLPAAYAEDEGDDFPVAPPDPDIADVCTPSDCNPASPCPDPDERCYSLNGVFYCCTMPPVPGMEEVGE